MASSHGQSETRRPVERPRTFFVDWQDLETKMTAAQAEAQCDVPRPSGRRRRILRSVAAEVQPVRRNVKDAAEAVATWVARVLDSRRETDLSEVLNRCLRPGPDIERVNYAALAEEISSTVGVALSAKRVQTAVNHLRLCNRNKAVPTNPTSLSQKLAALHQQLEANYTALIDSEAVPQDASRRSMAVAVLGAVRSAAGHLIENDFGEGICAEIDLDALEGRFLDFVRDMVKQGPLADQSTPLARDLRRLLLDLGQFDGSTEDHMRLVVDGSAVVATLVGPDSLPGLIAQLNVLVVGRYLLDSQLYCAELLRLAAAAAALHDDPQTRRFMNWVRRQDQDQRLPNPIRAASYCWNNAATHILERLYLEQWPQAEVESWLAKARQCLDQMRDRDSGFRLIQTTELIRLIVVAKFDGDDEPIHATFKAMGAAKALALLGDLIRFDNCPQLIQAARQYAVTALPELKDQLIYVE